MSEALERRVEFSGAKDWRRSNPSRNFGHIGVRLYFYIIGPKGAIQWALSPGWYVPTSREALRAYGRSRFDEERNWMPAAAFDLGYHAHEPQYKDQTPMAEECHLIGGQCFYDGTSLGAEELVEGFIAGGTDWLWPKLEAIYRAWFEGGEYPDFTPEYAPHPDDVRAADGAAP